MIIYTFNDKAISYLGEFKVINTRTLDAQYMSLYISGVVELHNGNELHFTSDTIDHIFTSSNTSALNRLVHNKNKFISYNFTKHEKQIDMPDKILCIDISTNTVRYVLYAKK